VNAIAVEKLKLLIFDLDGVITSEQKYWHTARLTVWELICASNYLGISKYFGESPQITTRLTDVGERVISSNFIYELKSRAINSNWDLTFFVVCLHLLAILKEINKDQQDDWVKILNQNVPIEQKFPELGKLIVGKEYDYQLSAAVIEKFWQQTKSLTGIAVLDYINYFVQRELGREIYCFAPKGELWQHCYDNFQDWYEGKKGYSLPDEETVLDLNRIATGLKALYNSGRYTLAIATGRPRIEVIEPMSKWGLLTYFDPQRIVTYDEVLAAESRHKNIKLGKPHPFVLYKATYPDISAEKLSAPEFELSNPEEIAYIGDAGSDVVAAKRAGCVSIGVLTGFGEGKDRDKKEQMLADLGCNIILDSILDLPQLLGVQIN